MINFENIIFKQILFASDEYKKLVALRNEELRKPLNLTISEADVANDHTCILLGGFVKDKLVACCMLLDRNNNTMQLRQMAVVAEYQSKGVGKRLLHYAEEEAKKLNTKKIILHARLHKKGFYEKFGYTTFGNEFIEATIPHIAMQKKF